MSKVEKYSRAGREDRRNLILSEAFKLFIESGYNDLKMDEIAHRAGFGKSTLYEYFKSKDEIFEEVLRVRVIEPCEAIAISVDRTLPPFEKIRAYLTEEMDFFLEFGGTENVLPVVMMHPEYFISPILTDACHKIKEHRYRTIMGFIREGTETGDFREKDPLLAATVIIGASVAFLGMMTDPKFAKHIKEKPNPAIYSERFFDMIKKALT